MLLDENFRVEPRAAAPWRYKALGVLIVLGAAASLLTVQPGRLAGGERPTAKAVEAQAKSPRSEAAPAKTKSAAGVTEAIKTGEAFLEKDDLDGAVAAFTKAIQLDPQDARAYVSRACVYKRKRDEEKASVDITKAIQLSPKIARRYFIRGWAYGRNRQIERVIKYLTENEQFDASKVGAASSRGYMNLVKGDAEKAAADFALVIRLKPGDSLNYAMRGFAYADIGEFDKAIADLTESVRLVPPGNPAINYSTRAYAYAEKRDFDRSFSDSELAATLYPSSSYASFCRGYAYWKKGDRDAANTAFAAAVRLEAAEQHTDEINHLSTYAANIDARRNADARRDLPTGVIVVDAEGKVNPPRSSDASPDASSGLTMEVTMQGDLWLRAYTMLSESDFRKTLQITAKQVSELREIPKAMSRQEQEGVDKINKESLKVPLAQRQAWANEAVTRLVHDESKTCAERVERVLTAQQLESYKTRVLRLRAYSMLHKTKMATTLAVPESVRQGLLDEMSRDTKMRTALAITDDQTKKLAQIENEWGKQAADQELGYHEKIAALLNPQQRDKLSEKVRSGLSMTVHGGTDEPSVIEDIDNLPGPYGDLGRPTVRAAVAFGLEQQKQLKEISTRYDKDRAGYFQRSQLISDEYAALARMSREGPPPGPKPRGREEINREGRELFDKLGQVDKAAARRIEALLSPQQLAKLKEIRFGNEAAIAVFDHGTTAEIGITEQQKTRLDQLAGQFERSQAAVQQAGAQRYFGVLTAAQKAILRAECDNRASW